MNSNVKQTKHFEFAFLLEVIAVWMNIYVDTVLYVILFKSTGFTCWIIGKVVVRGEWQLV